MTDAGSTLVGLLFLAALAVMYVFPSIVAFQRDHPQRGAICTLNLLLGWTLLGWVGALVWALTNQAGGVVPTKDAPYA